MQHTNAVYVTRLYIVDACVGLAAVSSLYQNIKASSFLKTLKTEEVNLNDYQTREDAYANIGYFLIEIYNERRPYDTA